MNMHNMRLYFIEIISYAYFKYGAHMETKFVTFTLNPVK